VGVRDVWCDSWQVTEWRRNLSAFLVQPATPVFSHVSICVSLTVWLSLNSGVFMTLTDWIACEFDLHSWNSTGNVLSEWMLAVDWLVCCLLCVAYCVLWSVNMKVKRCESESRPCAVRCNIDWWLNYDRNGVCCNRCRAVAGRRLQSDGGCEFTFHYIRNLKLW